VIPVTGFELAATEVAAWLRRHLTGPGPGDWARHRSRTFKDRRVLHLRHYAALTPMVVSPQPPPATVSMVRPTAGGGPDRLGLPHLVADLWPSRLTGRLV